MLSGRERLRDWIDRSKFTQREAAAVLGISDVELSLYLSGKRAPNLASALKIQDVTGIGVRSWALSGVSTSDKPKTAASRVAPELAGRKGKKC